jgi:hypothetical protein
VRVNAREKAAGRREAVEALLPLFLTDAARRDGAAALEAEVLSKAKEFVGREARPKKGDVVVEVRVDALAAALLKTNLVRPPGYASGPEVLLIAFGDRAVGPDPTERFAADALEVALFAHGIQAHDADDRLVQLKHPITAKTEAGTVAQAASGGWAWLAAGRIQNAAHQEPQSGAWRGRARLSLSLYDAAGSSVALAGDGEALDVSSASAVSHAIEQAAQDAAVRIEAAMTAKKSGRETFAVLLTGDKQPSFVSEVIGDLRRTPGVAGAALVGWRAAEEEAALVHVFVTGMALDQLAGRLMHDDPALRVTAIETEDKRLTLAGPDIPPSRDRGE